jgi:hypothetical protein
MANQGTDGNGIPYLQAINIGETAYDYVHQTSNAMHVHMASAAAALELLAKGTVAEDAAVSDAPVYVGNKAVSDITAASVGDGDVTGGRADVNGRLHVTMSQALATIGSAVLATAIQVAGTDGTNARTLATDANGYVKQIGPIAEDAAVSVAPVYSAAKAVSDITAASVDDGDVTGLRADVNGRLHVTAAEVTATDGSAKLAKAIQIAGEDGTNAVVLNVDSSGHAQVDVLSAAIAGDIAHDAADSGSPLKIGGKAESTEPSAVADADRVTAYFGVYGEQYFAKHNRVETLFASAAVSSDATETAVSGMARYSQAEIVLKCSAAASTAADLLDVYIDTSFDGTTWINVGLFTELVGNGGAKTYHMLINPASVVGTTITDVSADLGSDGVRHILGDRLRARFDITDDSGSAEFTCEIKAFMKQ